MKGRARKVASCYVRRGRKTGSYRSRCGEAPLASLCLHSVVAAPGFRFSEQLLPATSILSQRTSTPTNSPYQSKVFEHVVCAEWRPVFGQLYYARDIRFRKFCASTECPCHRMACIRTKNKSFVRQMWSFGNNIDGGGNCTDHAHLRSEVVNLPQSC